MCSFSLLHLAAAVAVIVISSFILFSLTVRTLSARLQIRSNGADVAGTPRYLTASFPKFMNWWADDFYQNKTFVSLSCFLILKFILTLAVCTCTCTLLISVITYAFQQVSEHDIIMIPSNSESFGWIMPWPHLAVSLIGEFYWCESFGRIFTVSCALHSHCGFHRIPNALWMRKKGLLPNFR